VERNLQGPMACSERREYGPNGWQLTRKPLRKAREEGTQSQSMKTRGMGHDKEKRGNDITTNGEDEDRETCFKKKHRKKS